jgi:mono/diheme cytochrome c family protein
MNVSVPAEDRALLLDWLGHALRPDDKAVPAAYVAREVTTFFTDAEGEALIKRACTSCHGIERVNTARYAPERWRVVTVDMRERGAKLEDEELERLVEWLGRTKGTNDSDRQ